MDRQKFSHVAHRLRRLCNPLSNEESDRLIGLLDLGRSARVLDVGCGKGEWLLRIVQRYGCTGVGVDSSQAFIEEARQAAEERSLSPRVQLHCSDMRDFHAAPESFDLVISVGASQVYGHHRDNVVALRRLVRPDGLVLVGEGYWKQAPPPEYLEALGASADDLLKHSGNVRVATDNGYLALAVTESSPEDWDEYESAYRQGVLDYSAAHPEDPDVPAMLERSRAWWETYQRWGRDTLGFGVYLLRRDKVPLAAAAGSA